ncbi:MAG: methylated-DNA--[protein]-cysteine S-methyltransferase [Sphingomonadaceae bacterium]
MSGFGIATPLGPMAFRLDGEGRLTHALFVGDAPPEAAPAPIAAAFSAWFAGDLHALDGLALAPAGSGFEQAVWAELRRIPPGETRSYAQIARALGGAASGPGPNARAVGTANARNPIAIAIPCHRVIGADGSLTGYAGGLERKAWLLAHEGWRPAQAALFA